MDREIRELQKEFNGGSMEPIEWVLRKFNQEAREGYTPALCTWMDTPFGRIWYNSDGWGPSVKYSNVTASGILHNIFRA